MHGGHGCEDGLTTEAGRDPEELVGQPPNSNETPASKFNRVDDVTQKHSYGSQKGSRPNSCSIPHF